MAFLGQACVDDDDLRQEVESLLAAKSEAGDFLSAGAMKDAAKMLADEKALPLVGKTLGHYELLSLLGAGGMGEVYRARDTNLGREVAVKVLPAAFSEDADRLRRFEQEARSVGMLNHPNILTIHEIGTHDGAPYIVSELLEGETLRDHLAQGELPTRQALDYALQVARGLIAAHEKGIVHRDLKPENLFITRDERVKILDFGLAKLTHSKLGVGMDTEASTIFAKTEPGLIMGTVGYMSPEQVREEDADSRSDIFAFGAILYEMLTGKRAFEGQSAVETMNAILKDDPPDLTATNQNLSPATERVVRHCLEKRPEKRFQSTNDLSFAIETLADPSGANLASPVQAPESAPIVVRRASRERFGWIVAAILLLATLALAIAYLQRAPVEVRAVRAFIPLPEKSSFNFIDDAGSVTISPDGRRLAFVAPTAEGKNLLWVRSLNELSAQPLTGTEGASFPFWSPDSRLLGFFADGKLKKIEAAGGPTLTLCDAPLARGGTWNRDGVIVFAPDSAGALQQISASGGASSAVTQLEEARSGTHRWPYFLPDGQHFLYLSRGATVSESETGAIYVASLESKGSKLLLRVSSNVAYAQGYLLFLREATLMAQAFDAKRLEMVGDAFPIAENVQSQPSIARGVFAVSENGVLTYQTGSATNGSQLAWFDGKGKQLSVLGGLAIYCDPQRVSPDGKKVMVTIIDPQTGNEDVWLYEVARGVRIRFTVDPADERFPVWSPDGSRIVFASNRKGHFDLYQKAPGGIGSDELLMESDLDKYPTSWSPDGGFLLYYTVDPKTKSDLWVLPLSGDRKPFPFLQTEFTEAKGQFSPDGGWIAYTSDESRRNEIYVMPFPGPGGKRQISTSGGSDPKWRGDGKEIFYLASDNKLMAVEVNGQGATLEVGAVRPLFEVRPTGCNTAYDLTSDGQRFLINTAVEQKASSPITLVLNWTADLKR